MTDTDEPTPPRPRRAVLDVRRANPPELGRCRSTECNRVVEWVITVKGRRRMPVDHPLEWDRVFEDGDGGLIYVIDGGRSHFATCPAAGKFRSRTAHDEAMRLVRMKRARGQRR